ncbi:hypothetical protein [Urbifossiella limnaea]|uniref:hypothetical protein n=1 Tax=Urbifossiella limnaea TaxID=2528023 RepID=UPI00119F049A|nr:hypothetical protein [Urbifossiella limnaea]
MLLRTDGDRTAYPVTLEGSRRRVLHVAAAIVFPKPGHPGREAEIPVESDPASCPVSATAVSYPGHRTGTNPARNASFVPNIPGVPASATWEIDPAASTGAGVVEGDVEVFAP